MDMMDVYVDDYSKPDPIPASWMDKLEQLSHLGDRGGRDRAEAERQRALAEAQARGEPGPAGAPPALADTPRLPRRNPPRSGDAGSRGRNSPTSRGGIRDLRSTAGPRKCCTLAAIFEGQAIAARSGDILPAVPQ